jgi:hypothetical protein
MREKKEYMIRYKLNFGEKMIINDAKDLLINNFINIEKYGLRNV